MVRWLTGWSLKKHLAVSIAIGLGAACLETLFWGLRLIFIGPALQTTFVNLGIGILSLPFAYSRTWDMLFVFLFVTVPWFSLLGLGKLALRRLGAFARNWAAGMVDTLECGGLAGTLFGLFFLVVIVAGAWEVALSAAMIIALIFAGGITGLVAINNGWDVGLRLNRHRTRGFLFALVLSLTDAMLMSLPMALFVGAIQGFAVGLAFNIVVTLLAGLGYAVVVGIAFCRQFFGKLLRERSL